MIEKAALGLERVMVQKAVLERDRAVKDDLGAKSAKDWQSLATLACFIWWGTGSVITRMGQIHQRPEETVDIETGGMILPEGTDVTPRDRIARVLDPDGNVLYAGPFQIISVGPFEGVTELLIRRVS